MLQFRLPNLYGKGGFCDMGKTITEKILAKASGKAEVSPGEYIHITIDRPQSSTISVKN